MGYKTLEVKSFTFNSETFYAEYHLNYPLNGQLSRVKSTFANARGESIEIYLDQLPDTQIDYSGSLTIFSDVNSGKVLKEFCCGVDSCIVNYPSAVEEFRGSLLHKKEFENVVTCLPGGGYNLHHFLFEILPALLTFKDEIRAFDALILGSTPGATFLDEFNEILELSQNLILIPINSSLRVKKSANITAVPFRIYPVEKIKEIRMAMLEKCGLTHDQVSPVVFIGRQDNDRNRRILVNESDVLDLLKSVYGRVEIVRPGVTKISETVKCIQGARVLIGPTGGNLAHLIWALDLELFIEIVPVGYPGKTETEELSQILGFEYQRVDSKSIQDGDWVYSDQECQLEILGSLLG